MPEGCGVTDGLSISEEDGTMDLVEYAYQTAKHYYQPETYDHAVRVVRLYQRQSLIPDALREICTALALMHDLLEDTEYQGRCGRRSFTQGAAHTDQTCRDGIYYIYQTDQGKRCPAAGSILQSWRI